MFVLIRNNAVTKVEKQEWLADEQAAAPAETELHFVEFDISHMNTTAVVSTLMFHQPTR